MLEQVLESNARSLTAIRHSVRQTFVLALTLLALLAGCGQPSSGSLTHRTAELLEGYLKGQAIELERLDSGTTFALPTLVSVDGSVDGQCLSVSFARADFDERFLQTLFYPADPKKIAALPPFTAPGVEAILTRDRVVLNLYSGVVVRFEPQLRYTGGLAVFKSTTIKGTVVKVIGPVVYTGSRTLPETLKPFLYLRDGKAFAYRADESDKQARDKQDAHMAGAMAQLSLTFKPAVTDQPVAPESVACTVKAFRNP
jgi:hypothetical protein